MFVIKVLIDFFKDFVSNTKRFLSCNSKKWANVFVFILPYCMFVAGVMVTGSTLKYILIKYWYLMLVPVVVLVLCSFLKYYANCIGRGDMCPIPKSRFTLKSNDGMVSVENNRLQELILYVSEVEDYLEEKGLL